MHKSPKGAGILKSSHSWRVFGHEEEDENKQWFEVQKNVGKWQNTTVKRFLTQLCNTVITWTFVL